MVLLWTLASKLTSWNGCHVCRGAPPLRPGALVGSVGDHGEPFLWIHHRRWEDLAPTTLSLPETPVNCAGLEAIALPPPSPPFCETEDVSGLQTDLQTRMKEDKKATILLAEITNDGSTEQEISGLKLTFPVSRTVRGFGEATIPTEAPASDFFAYCQGVYIIGGERWVRQKPINSALTLSVCSIYALLSCLHSFVLICRARTFASRQLLNLWTTLWR